MNQVNLAEMLIALAGVTINRVNTFALTEHPQTNRSLNIGLHPLFSCQAPPSLIVS